MTRQPAPRWRTVHLKDGRTVRVAVVRTTPRTVVNTPPNPKQG